MNNSLVNLFNIRNNAIDMLIERKYDENFIIIEILIFQNFNNFIKTTL